METKTKETRKLSGKPLKTKTLLIASVGCLAVAFLCLLIPSLLTALQNNGNNSYNTLIFTSAIGNAISAVWVSLLMPVSFLLLASSTEKAKLSKLLLALGATLVIVQLLSSLVGALCLLVERFAYRDSYGSSYSSSIFYAIEVLISPVKTKVLLTAFLSFLLNWFDGGYGGFLNFLVALLSAFLRTVAALLIIASNAICTYGCFRVGARKAEVKEEAEETAEE